MSIDLQRFHQTFFEESFEGLEAMEAALLRLDPGAPDSETVNTIFRAAHSIKGGAGTFGFSEIAAFTHHLETLLDQVRAGQRATDQALIELVLRSVDVLREMLETARDGGTVSINAEVFEALRSMSAGEPPAVSEAPVTAPMELDAGHWQIRFVPKPDIMLCGNDPLRILRELGRLGDMQLTADLNALPEFSDLDPEQCYLSWTASLDSDASEADIRDVFAWVEDDCDLSIERAGVVAGASESQSEMPLETRSEAQAPTASAVKAEAATPVATAAAPRLAVNKPAAKESSSIRVAVEKIDELINLVGELVITQAMLQESASALDPVSNEKLLSGLSELDRNTRHLQEAVMSTRMLPVDFVFSRFPRVVRDTATRLGKQVVLQTEGEGAELDKGVIEKIVDPLNHIVRNAIDHGVEMPADRKAAGKPAEATIRLRAWHQGGHIAIQVSDDGRGLNREKILAKAREAGMPVSDSMPDAEVWPLIFAPGLSTAAEVTDISGRGVGMDVVRKNIQSLGGGVEIVSTPGKGTEVTIRLPLTLAILDGMSVRVGEEIYILPLNTVVESLQPTSEELKSIAGKRQVLRVRGNFLPLLSVREYFKQPASHLALEESIVVIVEAEGRQMALVVDELVGQQQVVIKNLEQNYRRVAGVSGATIMGDGRVALILDVGDIVRANQIASAA